AVVAIDRLNFQPELLTQTSLDRQRPRRVDARAKRGQHAHAPVAKLVAEALDQDRLVVGSAPGVIGLVPDVLDEILRGGFVATGLRLKVTERRLIGGPGDFSR